VQLETKKKMKIAKEYKIESACAKNNSGRYSIENPFLDRSESGDVMIATDGRILAIVPVECTPEDDQGPVPRECLKDARKFGVNCNGVAAVPGGASYPRPDATFPDWRAVMPDFKGKKTVRLGIDAALLKRLADAIGTEKVNLEFPVDESSDCVIEPLTVRPAGFSDKAAHGVIMPCRVG
jgi:hypothetical protein